jgi:hypothetical protein
VTNASRLLFRRSWMQEETRLAVADDIPSDDASATGCGPCIFNGELSPVTAGCVAALAPDATHPPSSSGLTRGPTLVSSSSGHGSQAQGLG